MSEPPPQRVSPIGSPDEYTLPGRPAPAASTVLDAYRQTQFILGGELALFAAALNLQIGLVKDAYPSRYRTHALAAIVPLWSRAFTYLGDALLLLTRGSYPSTLPLVRAAAEAIAAQEGLRGGEMEAHHDWLRGTLRPVEAFKAFEFALGRYFAGEPLASDPVLRAVYRPASDLGRPNFGASLLQVAPESNNTRLAIAFGDASFHLGWAEIVAGWLLALASRQLRTIVDAAPTFPISDERRVEYEAIEGRVDAALARSDRAAVQEVEDGSNRRYLLVNFRRTAGAAPKRVLL